LDPQAFVIGIDASASAMAEVSRRAARAAAKGGQPNVLFAVAAAERPPAELIGRVDQLTVTMPWGSLLRGVLALDERAAAGISSLLGRAGELVAILSVTERDGLDVPGLDTEAFADGLAGRWAARGLRIDAFEAAGVDDMVATGSSWARRLSADRSRPAWRFRATCTANARVAGAQEPPADVRRRPR
jgi:16S rRNA (adenine(1408)-N(1))-methyltransferase